MARLIPVRPPPRCWGWCVPKRVAAFRVVNDRGTTLAYACKECGPKFLDRVDESMTIEQAYRQMERAERSKK